MADVLITGASRGIGYALTREYLARGARVFATVRDSERAVAVRDLARGPAMSGQVVPVRLDVTSEDDRRAASDLVAAQSDGLDLVVNNAGEWHATEGLAGIDGDRMLELLAVNTVAPVLVAQRFLPMLRPGGRLVNITMPTRPIAELARTGNHAFVASRYALNALTKMIAVEFADSGRVVVALWPGYLRTDLNGHAEAATPLVEAIPGVVDLIERLGPADHGHCVLPDGTHAPW